MQSVLILLLLVLLILLCRVLLVVLRTVIHNSLKHVAISWAAGQTTQEEYVVRFDDIFVPSLLMKLI